MQGHGPIVAGVVKSKDDLSQLIAVQYDMEQFGMGTVTPVDETVAQSPQTEKKMVVLTIPEPLPARKELTSNVEEHWIKIIHDAITRESKTGLPYFEKAFVLIRIWTPRGTNNKRIWDTSNRAINVVINNLKGIFLTMMTSNIWPVESPSIGVKSDKQRSGFAP